MRTIAWQAPQRRGKPREQHEQERRQRDALQQQFRASTDGSHPGTTRRQLRERAGKTSRVAPISNIAGMADSAADKRLAVEDGVTKQKAGKAHEHRSIACMRASRNLMPTSMNKKATHGSRPRK